MSRCTACNETDPSPVSTVNVTATYYYFSDGEVEEHEWSNTPAVPTTNFTMDETFVGIFFVAVGGVIQSAASYTITGTSLVFGAAVPAGAKVVVKGFIAP